MDRPKLAWAKTTGKRNPDPDRGPFDAFTDRCTRAMWEAFFSVPAEWMNSYHTTRTLQHDKIRQMALARQAGFPTIPTLVTDSSSDFIAFVKSLHGTDVAIKSVVSQHFETVDSTRVYGTYTRRN